MLNAASRSTTITYCALVVEKLPSHCTTNSFNAFSSHRSSTRAMRCRQSGNHPTTFRGVCVCVVGLLNTWILVLCQIDAFFPLVFQFNAQSTTTRWASLIAFCVVARATVKSIVTFCDIGTPPWSLSTSLYSEPKLLIWLNKTHAARAMQKVNSLN